MSDEKQKAAPKTPPVELDTNVPEPEDITQLPHFLLSSPSFRRVFYGTTGAFMMAVAGTAYVYFNGPDPTHNPLINGMAQKYFPELKLD